MENEEDKIKISKASFREWLEKLQQESWQLELLISGFALFAIWEARTLVDGFEEYLAINGGAGRFSNVFYNNFANLLSIGWRIFFFNLLIHVLARGLWIGAIGLRYVSSDIDYDYFDYADNFTNFLKRRVGDFDDYIEKLERFSSVIFAYTFLLFFIFLSLLLFFTEVLCFAFIFDDRNIGGMVIILLGILGLFAFIDFITMGGIKKIKEKNISRIYFIFYRIFSFLTLSFLYRPLLYNFWDEKYTRRLFLVSIPYILLLVVLPKIESTAYPFYPIFAHNEGIIEKVSYDSYYYDDERQLAEERKKGIFRPKTRIFAISLPSIELTGNYGRFFLKSYQKDSYWLEDEKEIQPYKSAGINYHGWGDVLEDSKIKLLDSLSNQDISQIFATKRVLRKKIRDKEITEVATGLTMDKGKITVDDIYWDAKLDSIRAYWQEKMDAFELNKAQKISKSILDLAEISIDGISYNDSCECKFYIHPNLGEKGLRCYFPMNNLAEGSHLLHLKRTRILGAKEDYRKEKRDFYIPFYKIQKDF